METTEAPAKLPIIFYECTADEDSRYAISTPFVRDGYVYATNGKCIVRMPSGEADTKGQCPNPSDLDWDRKLYEDEPADLPSEAPMSDCEHCDGGLLDCPTCGQETGCEHCDGKGRNYEELVEVADSLCLRGYFAERLIRHRGRLYLRKDRSDGKYAWRFEVDGGIEGLVLPVRRD